MLLKMGLRWLCIKPLKRSGAEIIWWYTVDQFLVHKNKGDHRQLNTIREDWEYMLVRSSGCKKPQYLVREKE
jgi:hypothetical protein